MNLRDPLTRLAFDFSRSLLGHRLVGLAFTHLSFALPVRRIIETPTLLSFYHPRPSHRVHILIVPRCAIPGPEVLAEEHSSLLRDVFQMAADLVGELSLEGEIVQLIVNGGAYQQIPQLHFHLVCDPVSRETSRS